MNENFKQKPVSKKQKRSQSNKMSYGSKIKDIITIVSSLLVPVILGVFTILSTYNQWRIENSRNEQQTKLETERHEQQILNNLEKYRNDLLGSFIERMGDMLKENNYSLTNDTYVAALACAKVFNTISQLDPERVSKVVRFLYETKIIAKVEGREPLDIATVNLSKVNGETFKTKKTKGTLSLVGILIENTNFDNIILADVDFSSATFRNVHFDFSPNHSSNRVTTNAHSVLMKNVSFHLATLQRVYAMSAKVENAVFDRAIIDEVILKSTSFFHVTLWSSTLVNVDFSNGHLMFINFSNARLENVKFTGAIFYHIIFDYSIMKNVDFDQATFYNVSFSNTKLDNVRFKSTTFCTYFFRHHAKFCVLHVCFSFSFWLIHRC